GAGFNPEFTGRENILVTGSILGLSEKVLNERIEEIIAFAEIGDYIDQPVKTYSTGMFVRLAFAVAIHTDPTLLIVDEALSVGDFNFQFKSFQKIEQLVAGGCAALLVSHDIGTIQKISDKVLYLDHGQVVECGDPRDVCARYLADSNRRAGRLSSTETSAAAAAEATLEPPFEAGPGEHNPLASAAVSEFNRRVEGRRQGGGEARILNVTARGPHGDETIGFD